MIILFQFRHFCFGALFRSKSLALRVFNVKTDFRLNAVQTECWSDWTFIHFDFFGLSGADFFFVLLFQLLLVPFVPLVLEPFSFRPVSAQAIIFQVQLPGSRGYCLLQFGFAHLYVLSATSNFGFHFAQYKHVFEEPLSPPPVMYFFPGVLRITCFSVSAKYPCARMAAYLRAFFPGPLYVCFDSS